MYAKAKEMCIPYRKAIAARSRYLANKLGELADFTPANELEERLHDAAVSEVVEEMKKLARPKVAQKEITESDIDAARSTPVTAVIEFTKGRAKAWCHDDRNPSLYYATRTNKAVCPVCDRYFDAIGVLMERDGLSFVDAVKVLAWG